MTTKEKTAVVPAQEKPVDALDAMSPQERAMMTKDLGKLSEEERALYVERLVTSLGLNPLTHPIQWVTFQGRLVPYVTRGATDQLRALHGITFPEKPSLEFQDGLCIAMVTGHTTSGRMDTEVGVVVYGGSPSEKANAIMKAVTKAKRRLTLTLCGLGMMAEDEKDTLIEDQPLPVREQPRPAPAVAPAPPPKALAAPAVRPLKEIADYATMTKAEYLAYLPPLVRRLQNLGRSVDIGDWADEDVADLSKLFMLLVKEGQAVARHVELVAELAAANIPVSSLGVRGIDEYATVDDILRAVEVLQSEVDNLAQPF